MPWHPIAIVQARLGSTRLPGKVLLDLAGQPLLARIVNRLNRAEMLYGVIVATTQQPYDDLLADFCAERGWPCYRGSEHDLLDRFYQAATIHAIDPIVRICADCPLVDPTIVDHALYEYRRHLPDIDYLGTAWPKRTWPLGLDVQVIGFPALKRAWEEDHNAAWREHVTPYIYRHPELFRLHGLANKDDLSHLRLTVDTPEDFELIRRIYEHFGHDGFSWQEVVDLLAQHPEWATINQHIRQKEVPP